MTLPALRNIDFEDSAIMDKSWFAHYQHHSDIVDAIQKQKSVTLIKYQIWPYNKDAIGQMLLKHQQYHDDMNSVLNINDGVDLQNVDFKDRKSTEAWVNNNFFEHLSVSQALKI